MNITYEYLILVELFVFISIVLLVFIHFTLEILKLSKMNFDMNPHRIAQLCKCSAFKAFMFSFFSNVLAANKKGMCFNLIYVEFELSVYLEESSL